MPDVAMCLNAGAMGRQDAETETLIPTHGGVFDVAHSLRGEGFDASEDGTGRGTPLVPGAIQERAVSENPGAGPDGIGCRGDGVAYTLEARTTVQAVAFDCKGTEVQVATDGSHPTLWSMGHSNSRQNAGGHAAVAWSIMPQNSGKDFKARAVDVAQPIMAGGPVGGNQGGDYIQTPWAVRRLTPRECERLQGFPYDHTLIPRSRKRILKDADDELAYLRATYPDMTADEALMLAADGPRYKALGNSMAVPVVRWIIDRIGYCYGTGPLWEAAQ